MAAGRNIKGITIEISGDTKGLQRALSGVNDKLKNTQAQLKDVNSIPPVWAFHYIGCAGSIHPLPAPSGRWSELCW